MGNCVSEYKEVNFRDDYESDPSAFRVKIKRKNKLYTGYLKIADEEIIFTRGSNIECWPLGYLRRYGYTRAGIFFFESGRRCKTGEGLHTFQSFFAERIFQIVQLRIKNVEIRNSRSSSVASSRLNAIANASRIYPVQRFSSEGANGQIFSVNQNASIPESVKQQQQAPAVPSRNNRPKSYISSQSPPPPSMTQSQIDFIDSWPNEQAPLQNEIISEHILRTKKPCADPICRQRKYHSYVNVELAEPQHRVLNYSQGNLSMYSTTSAINGFNGPTSMSASYCAQPSTSTIMEEPSSTSTYHRGHHNASAYDPMTMSASAALGQNPLDPSPRLSYATLAMPENGSISSSSHRGASQRSDCSSSSSAPGYRSYPSSRIMKNPTPSVNYTRIDLTKSSQQQPPPNYIGSSSHPYPNNVRSYTHHQHQQHQHQHRKQQQQLSLQQGNPRHRI
jgi:hypothetical protein